MEILRENMTDEKGDRSGILNQAHDMVQQIMKPGPHLDELNRKFLRELTPYVNALAKRGGPEKIKLCHWLRHHFSLASAAAVYGPENLFALNAALEHVFGAGEVSILSAVLANTVDGGQNVPLPVEGKKMPIAQGLLQPGRDVEVGVSRRKGV
ncbi:hypothetical protein LTR36_006898 [Oleoguttula mirabilis]|uniref:Uncharacterized protein n=1 Tax=Oleoguttula mirabilis TaxID=1507867 RepID=A0AAV9JAV2_9PEZI|nr:hypothetical protein LTR36_006898 [Oleoguttula mirabilis]